MVQTTSIWFWPTGMSASSFAMAVLLAISLRITRSCYLNFRRLPKQRQPRGLAARKRKARANRERIDRAVSWQQWLCIVLEEQPANSEPERQCQMARKRFRLATGEDHA
jgi:hypothetical protein